MNAWIDGKRRSMISRGLWILAWALPIALWAILSLPVPAQSAANCGTVQQCLTNAIGTSPGAGANVGPLGWFDPTSQIVSIAAGWLPNAQGMAQTLYGILFTIELFMLGFQTILFRDNLGELFSGLTFKVFVTGFIFWFISDAADIFTNIIGSFNQAGQTISGASKNTLQTLYGEESGAVTLYITALGGALLSASEGSNLCDTSAGCAHAISITALPLAAVCGMMAMLLFGSLTALSLTYILITVEAVIVMCGGVFFLGLAGLRFTKPYSDGYLKYAVNTGIKLFTFWLVVSIEGALMPGVLANAGLTAGAAMISTIPAAIVAISGEGVAADIAGDTAKVASVKGAEAAGIPAAAIGIGALATGEAATATSPGDDAGLGTAMETSIAGTEASKDGIDAAAEGPGNGADLAARKATIAASTVAVAAAVTAAVAAILFAAFGGLQIVVLNTLASAVPTIAASLTSGSSALSAHDALKGIQSTLLEASTVAATLKTKVQKGLLDRQSGLVNKLAREEQKTDDSTAPSQLAQQTMAPNSTTQPGFILPASGKVSPTLAGKNVPPVAPINARSTVVPPVASHVGDGIIMPSGILQQTPSAAQNDQPFNNASPPRNGRNQQDFAQRSGSQEPEAALSPNTASNPQQQLSAREQLDERLLKRDLEQEMLENGFTSYNGQPLSPAQQRARFNELTDTKKARYIAGVVNKEYAKNPALINEKQLSRARLAESRLEKSLKENSGGTLRGLLAAELIATSTHQPRESGGGGGFGDSGIRT